jgi:hypothetical protein
MTHPKPPVATVDGLDYYRLADAVTEDPGADRRRRGCGTTPVANRDNRHWLYDYACAVYLARRAAQDALIAFKDILDVFHEGAKEPESAFSLKVTAAINAMTPVFRKQVTRLLCGEQEQKTAHKAMQIFDLLEQISQGVLDIDAALNITGDIPGKVGLRIIEDRKRRAEVMGAKILNTKIKYD